MLTARKGVSALQLSKEVGCQYKTAWYMLHRIREACDQGSFILQEVVEADETFIGGKEGNKHASKKLHAGRGTVGKTPVAGVRQRDGRVVAKPVESTTAQTLSEFIESVVKRGSTVYTDDATAYQHLANVLNEYKKTLRLNIVKASMYVVKFIRVV